MLTRLLNLFLLIAAVIGVVLAYGVAKKHRELSTEHRRLEAKVGSLPIGDPSKIHIRALETGEDLHFAWRVYVPAGERIKWAYDGGGGSGSSWSSNAGQYIARVRFRENEDGSIHAFAKLSGGSSRFQLGGQALADLLRDRWDEIQVEQLASDDVVAIDASEVATLLRLTLPDDLKQEGEQKVRKAVMRRFQAGLFGVRFGSDKAFQQAAAKGQAADGL